MKDQPYSQQDFADAAKRRAREARILLDQPDRQKQRDGAVLLALLAAECALKAALMYAHRINNTDEAEASQHNRWFRGTSGHSLQILWNDQSAGQHDVAAQGMPQAVKELNQLNPYSYRYGQRKPRRAHAEPYVAHADTIVAWMNHITGLSA